MFRDTLLVLGLLMLSGAPELDAREAAQSEGDHDHAEPAHDRAAETHAEDDHDHVAEAHRLRAVHAWTRATDGPEALVFLEIENRGDTQVSLTGASSPHAAAGGLVGFQLVDGAESYTELAAMPIDAGGALTLAPRALAIRLEGLDGPLREGESVPVAIATSAGTLTMTVAVEAADAAAHSHAGHGHD